MRTSTVTRITADETAKANPDFVCCCRTMKDSQFRAGCVFVQEKNQKKPKTLFCLHFCRHFFMLAKFILLQRNALYFNLTFSILNA